jgi:tetratricopeptide (TPR) repeat protein
MRATFFGARPNIVNLWVNGKSFSRCWLDETGRPNRSESTESLASPRPGSYARVVRAEHFRSSRSTSLVVTAVALALTLVTTLADADVDDPNTGQHVVLGADEYLSAGADSIRAGRYDDGIRLTKVGLERGLADTRNRAAGLANLCAAYVAKREPDTALPYCDQALELNDANWRAYSNRSHAYLLKERYAEAASDNEAAAALAPNAAHVLMIKRMLNERTLQPSITIEEHH